MSGGEEQQTLVPLLPDDLDANFSEHDIFATLSPSNPEAVRAFSKLIGAIQDEPHVFERHSEHVRLDAPHRMPLASVVAKHASHSSPHASSSRASNDDVSGGSFSSDATLTSPAPEELVWSGCYVFSFSRPPLRVEQGWRAGCGPYANYSASLQHRPASFPDLLLSLDASASKLGLHRTTCLFNFHPSSHQFSIIAGHGYNDSRSSTARKGSVPLSRTERLMLEPSELITLGSFEYKFEHAKIQPARLGRVKLAYISNSLRDTDPKVPVREDLGIATPTPNDVVIAGWRIMNRSGSGTEGTVDAACSVSNEVVAMKTVLRRTKQDDQVIQEKRRVIDLLGQRLIDDPDGEYVQRLRDFVDRYPGLNALPDQVYFLYTPLALYDFDHFMRSSSFVKWTTNNKLLAFTQLLRGLAAIHRAGFVHDDIKPKNIGLISPGQPKILILDLDSLKDIRRLIGKTPLPATHGQGGTIGYLAPEREGVARYGSGADIWAAGCFGLKLFFGETIQHRMNFNPWRDSRTWPAYARPLTIEIDHEQLRYKQCIAGLKDARLDSIEDLLARMLAFSPEERISASDALAHGVLKKSIHTIEGSRVGIVSTGSKRQREYGS